MLQPEHKAALQKFSATHNGQALDQNAMAKANSVVSKILVARFLKMTPQQQEDIKGIVTDQTAGALEILLPELKGLIKKGGSNGTR